MLITAEPGWEFIPNHCPCGCDLDPSWHHVDTVDLERMKAEITEYEVAAEQDIDASVVPDGITACEFIGCDDPECPER